MVLQVRIKLIEWMEETDMNIEGILLSIQFSYIGGKMGEHFITQIYINSIRHLHNLKIVLSEEKRQNLIITGKNGVGKTTLLESIGDYLVSIQEGNVVLRQERFKSILDKKIDGYDYDEIMEQTGASQRLARYAPGIEMDIHNLKDVESVFYSSEFILAYFSANRWLNMKETNGVEKIKLFKNYGIDKKANDIFHKYLVDLKTQQLYAKMEDDKEYANKLTEWFETFNRLLKMIYQDQSINLEYDYKNYTFWISQDGRERFDLHELSSGYSAVLDIISDIIIRMEGARKRNTFDIEGIVLIDEIETHLHIELQKSILPILTGVFPNIQFIITTHSPFVLSSIQNTIVYDLERNIRIEDMSSYSYTGIVEQYFYVDIYSKLLKDKLDLYRELVAKKDLTEEERAKRAKIRNELNNIPGDIAKEIKNEFFALEEKRQN